VTFLPGNEKLTIRQEFKGTDELDHLVVRTTLDGQVPEVPSGSTMQIDPYSEVYQYNSNCKTQLELRSYISFPLLRKPPGSQFFFIAYLSILPFSDHLIFYSELHSEHA